VTIPCRCRYRYRYRRRRRLTLFAHARKLLARSRDACLQYTRETGPDEVETEIKRRQLPLPASAPRRRRRSPLSAATAAEPDDRLCRSGYRARAPRTIELAVSASRRRACICRNPSYRSAFALRRTRIGQPFDLVTSLLAGKVLTTRQRLRRYAISEYEIKILNKKLIKCCFNVED